jgi:hypothetical protein
MSDRPRKPTFANMRDIGVRGLLIYFCWGAREFARLSVPESIAANQIGRSVCGAVQTARPVPAI